MRLVASAWLCSSTCSTGRSSHDSTERSFHTNGSGVGSPSGRRFCGIWLPGGVQVGSGVSEVQAAFGATHTGNWVPATKTNLSSIRRTSDTCLLADHELRQCDPGKKSYRYSGSDHKRNPPQSCLSWFFQDHLHTKDCSQCRPFDNPAKERCLQVGRTRFGKCTSCQRIGDMTPVISGSNGNLAKVKVGVNV